jgi:hypothetical protein
MGIVVFLTGANGKQDVGYDIYSVNIGCNVVDDSEIGGNKCQEESLTEYEVQSVLETTI